MKYKKGVVFWTLQAIYMVARKLGLIEKRYWQVRSCDFEVVGFKTVGELVK